MKKLLIADDQAGIRMLLSEVFKNEGYETILASNGEEAVQKLQTSKPDCILLDMKMPGLNGEEILQEIKSRCPDFPVILMSAYDKAETSAADSDVQADHYFTKPFDIHDLRRTISKLMQDS
ncbi:response regulator [Sporosarcina sp. NCCP-2716]|nr:response regulator [Sporosarcina sp. NCCP-2716]